MNDFLIFVNEHIPDIISYVLIIIGYMFYFFVKIGAKKGMNSIRTLFKEKSSIIENTDKSMRDFVNDRYSDLEKCCNLLSKENELLKHKYDKIEKALNILIGGDTDDTNGDDE